MRDEEENYVLLEDNHRPHYYLKKDNKVIYTKQQREIVISVLFSHLYFVDNSFLHNLDGLKEICFYTIVID